LPAKNVVKHSFIMSHFWSNPKKFMIFFFAQKRIIFNGFCKLVLDGELWHPFVFHFYFALGRKKFHMIHMDAFYWLPNLMVTNGTQHLGPIIQKICNFEGCPKLKRLNFQWWKISISHPKHIYTYTLYWSIQLEVP